MRAATVATLRLGAGPTPTAPNLVPPPPHVGDYTVLGPLARGGMSGVYLSEHRRTGERVAVKLLADHWLGHAGVVQRLLDEHELASRVDHDGVVAIHAAGRTEDGVPYLRMELLDGENLGCLLERGRLELGAAVAIAAQVAEAAAALHGAGVIHCDIKPDNLMLLYRAGLSGWPAVKIIDFGVARLAHHAIDEVAGTPAYMAPEQWSGRAEDRTDVYGLGCTLYELVTGAPPFDGPLLAVRSAHCDELPVPPSAHRSLPDELERLILRMLAKDARMRPRMADVARVLGELARALPPGVGVDPRITATMLSA